MTRSLAMPVVYAIVTFTLTIPGAAQNELGLRRFFEGKRVTLKIDMPATSDGVDLKLGTEYPLDYKVYGRRLAETGNAIRAGESAIVTSIHVKKDLIEFQLGGGGFAYESSFVYIPLVEKSNHEKDLEKEVKAETDSVKKRALQRELDDVQDVRERENARISLRRQEAEEEKKARISIDRLRAGSRFNLRYAKSVPEDVKPEDVIAALDEYVEFNERQQSYPTPTPSGPLVRKGMLLEEAEQELGKPTEASDRKEGTLTVKTLAFVRGEQRIIAEFVDDVLFRYMIGSK